MPIYPRVERSVKNRTVVENIIVVDGLSLFVQNGPISPMVRGGAEQE